MDSIQPVNTAAALSLANNPIGVRYEKFRKTPKMVAAIRENGQVYKRGRPPITPTNPNWGKYRVRVVGLDGSVIKERAFQTKRQRLSWRRQVQLQRFVNISHTYHVKRTRTHART